MFKKIITQTRPSVNVPWFWLFKTDGSQLFEQELSKNPSCAGSSFELSPDGLTVTSTILFDSEENYNGFINSMSPELLSYRALRTQYNIDMGITTSEESLTY